MDSRKITSVDVLLIFAERAAIIGINNGYIVD